MVLIQNSWANNQSYLRPDTNNSMRVPSKSVFGLAALVMIFVLIVPDVSWAHDASKLRKKNAKITCESLAQTDPAKIDRNNTRVLQMLKLCEAKQRLREARSQQRQADLSLEGQPSWPLSLIVPSHPEYGLVGNIDALTPHYQPTATTLPNSRQSSPVIFRGTLL